MELYHVLNRGVDKRTLFLDNSDRARFVHDLWEFNDIENAQNVRRHSLPTDMTGFVNPSLREPIVDLHAWCVMGNHYHLLISERTEGGLTKFIRRLNVGYANYFNERYKRTGALFQGRTKKIPILTDAHFLHILNYIHSNPLDLRSDCKKWRERKLDDATRALRYLQKYRWSSYLDYTGIRNFPSVITTELFSDIFPNYERELHEFLSSNEAGYVSEYHLERQ